MPKYLHVLTQGILLPSWVTISSHMASSLEPNLMHDDLASFINISTAISSCSTRVNSFYSSVTDGDIIIRSSAYMNMLTHANRMLQQ